MNTQEPLKQALYQVFVEDKDGDHFPITPKMVKPVCAKVLIDVKTALDMGKLPGWGNPHMALAVTVN